MMKWREVFLCSKSKVRRKDQDGEIERLKSQVRELERRLQTLKSQQQQEQKTNTTDHNEIVLDFGGSLQRSMDSLYSSSRSTGNDSNGTSDEKYHQQGIFARPECQQRYRYDESKGKKERKKDKQRARSKSGRKVKNSDELVSQYCAISALGPVMKECKKLCWKQSMYTPFASQFLHAPIPRITLSALDNLLGEHSDPKSKSCELRIFRDPEETNVKEICNKYQGEDSALLYDLVWANRANLVRFGHTNLQSYSEQFRTLFAKAKYHQMTMESINFSIFERGDLQPKRQMYSYYGSKLGVLQEARPVFVQFSPVLVEVAGKINLGLFIETNAPWKYPKEVKNVISRAHGVFKYTESAVTIFTTCGTILQQNPSSSKIFGLEACGNNVFSDFEKDGKPVNRLRALFGDNESQYEEMMETLMEKGQVWCSRMKLGREHLMPELRLLSDRSLSGSSSGGTTLSFDSIFSSEDNPEVQRDRHVWYAVQLLKFGDPADGKTAIFCEMDNIHSAVLQEERLRAAKKHEYEILQNIIPPHIIEHLLEKEKEAAAARRLSPQSSSGSSHDSLNSLDMSDFRMIDDNKVSAMAQHYSQVTVCFVDIVGFTNMSSHSTPADIMIMLNRLFTLFDDMSDNHNIYKVETIGDVYMCVAGLNMKSEGSQDRMNMPASNEEDNTSSEYHASRMLLFTKDVLSIAKTVISPENTPVEVRIGLHTGDVVTGVVGYKMPRFCLFGDTVNVASRMESTGRAGHIHASRATRDHVPHEHWIPTGGVEVKGKGLVPTYLYGGGGVENG
jgi:class 3 adenylate cyclase